MTYSLEAVVSRQEVPQNLIVGGGRQRGVHRFVRRWLFLGRLTIWSCLFLFFFLLLFFLIWTNPYLSIKHSSYANRFLLLCKLDACIIFIFCFTTLIDSLKMHPSKHGTIKYHQSYLSLRKNLDHIQCML